MAFIQLVSRKGIKHDKNRSEKEGKKETVLEKELILYSTYTHTQASDIKQTFHPYSMGSRWLY